MVRAASKASLPLATVSTRQPRRLRIWTVTLWLIRLSSERPDLVREDRGASRTARVGGPPVAGLLVPVYRRAKRTGAIRGTRPWPAPVGLQECRARCLARFGDPLLASGPALKNEIRSVEFLKRSEGVPCFV